MEPEVEGHGVWCRGLIRLCPGVSVEGLGRNTEVASQCSLVQAEIQTTCHLGVFREITLRQLAQFHPSVEFAV
jgi:hypothetical protein